MRVYNLTEKTIVYKNRALGPYESAEFDMSFVPDRDKKLSKVLAFGALPKGWKKPQPKPEAKKEEPKKETLKEVIKLEEKVKEAPKEVVRDFRRKKYEGS